MNREIKFRGKSEFFGQWVDGSLQVCKCGSYRIHFINGGSTKVPPETIGQYTGLKDRNGKEIYEWDILNIRFGAEEIVPMVVCFVNGSWCIHEDSNYEEFHNLYDYCYAATIIGNIHDNPELLKGGK